MTDYPLWHCHNPRCYSLRLPEPIVISGNFDVACDCGRRHTGNYMTAKDASWRCECGELHYIDPAGRAWGTEALTYAHKTHGYFPNEWFDGN